MRVHALRGTRRRPARVKKPAKQGEAAGADPARWSLRRRPRNGRSSLWSQSAVAAQAARRVCHKNATVRRTLLLFWELAHSVVPERARLTSDGSTVLRLLRQHAQQEADGDANAPTVGAEGLGRLAYDLGVHLDDAELQLVRDAIAERDTGGGGAAGAGSGGGADGGSRPGNGGPSERGLDVGSFLGWWQSQDKTRARSLSEEAVRHRHTMARLFGPSVSRWDGESRPAAQPHSRIHRCARGG